MIDAQAARSFSLDGRPYAKGEPLRLAPNQFADLESCGLVAKAQPKAAEGAGSAPAPAKARKRATPIASPGE